MAMTREARRRVEVERTGVKRMHAAAGLRFYLCAILRSD